MDTLELRNALRELGYNAKIANVDCFDIEQVGFVHYLSSTEAHELLRASQKYGYLVLIIYAEKRGLNYWYTFPE